MLPLCFCAFFPSVSDWWQVVLFLCSSLPPDAVLTWVPSPGPSNRVLFFVFPFAGSEDEKHFFRSLLFDGFLSN